MRDADERAHVHFFDDPSADARSLMHRAPCPCNGEVNGVQCKHYWALSQKFRAANSDTVRLGEKQRGCHLVPGFFLEFKSHEKPTSCQSYEPRKVPGLIALVKRAVALAVGLAPRAERLPRTFMTVDGMKLEEQKTVDWGYVSYDGDFEDFHPMTLAEIEKLREKMPDTPAHFSHGNPATMSVGDIVNGPQVAILKPGETVPGSDTKSMSLNEATEEALSDIFGKKEE